jgi:hypothetical protein
MFHHNFDGKRPCYASALGLVFVVIHGMTKKKDSEGFFKKRRRINEISLKQLFNCLLF